MIGPLCRPGIRPGPPGRPGREDLQPGVPIATVT